MRRRKCIHFVLLIFISLLILLLFAPAVYGQYQFNFLPYHWRPSHIGLDYDHLSPAWRNIVYYSRMTWNNAGAGVVINYDANSWCDVWVDYFGDTGWYGWSPPIRTAGSWYEEVDVFINLSYHPQFHGQTVVTHELGHFLGLAHQDAYPSVMRTNYAGVDTNLHDYDIRAIFALYPAFHRLYTGVEHFYTQYESERDALVQQGWIYEGVACYGWGGNVADTLTFWRMFNGVDHFYTINWLEVQAAQAGGYWLEGPAIYVIDTQQVDVYPLYRLYNGVDHYYTVSGTERDALVAQGWRDENVAAYVRLR